jgi:hypothetical protein
VPDTSKVTYSYRLVIDDKLAVSFQRYPEAMVRGAAELPRSYGAVPVERSSPMQALLPAREGEGIWLGISPRTSSRIVVQIAWLGAGPDLPLPWSKTVSALELLHGLIKPSGTFCPFIRFPLNRAFLACPGIVISVEKNPSIPVQFASVAEYEASSGKRAPRPISPNDCYGGWPLP